MKFYIRLKLLGLFLFVFMPVVVSAQPDWYSTILPNDFENQTESYFAVTLSDNDSKEKVLTKASMMYMEKMYQLIGSFGAFVYKETKKEGLDLNRDEQENMFLKEVYTKAGNYWSNGYPGIVNIDVEYKDGKHHAYIMFRVERRKLAYTLNHFIANNDFELFMKFKQTNVFNTSYNN